MVSNDFRYFWICQSRVLSNDTSLMVLSIKNESLRKTNFSNNQLVREHERENNHKARHWDGKIRIGNEAKLPLRGLGTLGSG